MIITHDNIEKEDRCEYQWQQWSIMRRISKMNVRALRMRNRLSKPREWTDKNLTGCLQGYTILQDEKTIKYLILNPNNIALQIVPTEHKFDFDFHRRPGGFCRTSPMCLNHPFRGHLVA
jgi:hypothetical protein